MNAMERNGVQNGSDFYVCSITVTKQVYTHSYDTLPQMHEYVQCNVKFKNHWPKSQHPLASKSSQFTGSTVVAL
jgi:hypothetical protein